MRSIILCEGPDDLWFSAYYLHKVAGWDDCKNLKTHWRYYKATPLNDKQTVRYYSKGNDSVAIWSVGGKDSFENPINTIKEKFISDFPQDPIDSIVILRDKDEDSLDTIIEQFSVFFEGLNFENCRTSLYSKEIDGEQVNVKVTPVIIPFEDCGAIESVLMEAISEANTEGAIIVNAACSYIDSLVNNPDIGKIYLTHHREYIKAKFAATIAATNPGHSTSLFQDMILVHPWEKAECVKKHFDVVLDAVSSN